MTDENRRERGLQPYQPSWRCEECGAVHDEHPESCDCGAESFTQYTEW